MAGISQWGIAQLLHPQLFGNAAEALLFRGEEAELRLLACQTRRKGIFYDACKGGVGKYEASLPPSFKLMREQAEGVGVSFEVRQVFPLLRREVRPQIHTFAFGKVSGDGPFARMPEGRIAQIVGKAGGRDNRTDFGQVGVLQLRAAGKDGFGHVVA